MSHSPNKHSSPEQIKVLAEAFKRYFTKTKGSA